MEINSPKKVEISIVGHISAWPEVFTVMYNQIFTIRIVNKNIQNIKK